jgi:hypothetical protein
MAESVNLVGFYFAADGKGELDGVELPSDFVSLAGGGEELSEPLVSAGVEV